MRALSSKPLIIHLNLETTVNSKKIDISENPKFNTKFITEIQFNPQIGLRIKIYDLITICIYG